MSEPEAKQYVLDGIERCREALVAIDSVDNPDLCDYRKAIEDVVKLVEGLKEKVFLKTKKANTPAYLLLEAGRNIAELAEELNDADEDTVSEFADAVHQLKESATKLQGASKQHSIIVT